MFGNAQKRRRSRPAQTSTQRGATAKQQARLYSIPALLKAREFVGKFEIADSSYKLVYAPARAEVTGGKLQLQGRLTITNSRGESQTRDSVRATLASTQGGMGTSPVRRQVLAGVAQTGTTATPQQQQQLAGEAGKPAAEKKPDEPAKAETSKLPIVESTGPLSFTGVMYFHFEPLDGRALGVPADLSRVQLNVRLAPTDDTARKLHGIYSSLVEALYDKRVGTSVTSELMSELNNLLAAS